MMVFFNGDAARTSGFITMLAGLMLFFGAISRIGKVSETPLLSMPQRNEPQKRLEDERQRIVALYGLRPPAAAHQPPAAPPPREESRPRPRALPHASPPPTAEPRPAPPPARQPEKKHYIVQPGDTLWGIARREYGDGNLLHILENANPGLEANSLRVGQAIVIPHLSPALTLGRGGATP